MTLFNNERLSSLYVFAVDWLTAEIYSACGFSLLNQNPSDDHLLVAIAIQFGRYLTHRFNTPKKKKKSEWYECRGGRYQRSEETRLWLGKIVRQEENNSMQRKQHNTSTRWWMEGEWEWEWEWDRDWDWDCEWNWHWEWEQEWEW